MRRNTFLLVLIFYLAVTLLLSEGASGQNYRFTHYTQEEGLPTASVDQVLRDKTGFFWLLSESDLTRFDGYDFKVYRNNPKDSTSVPESFVDMYLTTDGTLYLRSVASISRFDAVHGTSKRLVTAADGYPVYDWTYENGHRFWATSSRKLLMFDGQSGALEKYDYPPGFQQVAVRVKCLGTALWLYNDAGQCMRFFIREKKYSSVLPIPGISEEMTVKTGPQAFLLDDRNVTHFVNSAGWYRFENEHGQFLPLIEFNGGTSHSRLQGNPAYRDGRIYACNSAGELLILDLAGPTLTRKPLGGVNNTRPNVHSLYVAYDGTLWISTTTSGAFHYSPASDQWEHFRYEAGNQNSLISNSTDIIYSGERNVAWINCAGRGLVKVEWIQPFLAPYSPNAGTGGTDDVLSENVRTVFPLDSGRLLVGTLGGLYSFDSRTGQFSSMPSPVDGSPILQRNRIGHIVSDHRGDIWIAEWGSSRLHRLHYQDKILQTIIPDSTLSALATLRVLFYDSRDNLWAGSDAGVLYRGNLKPLYHDSKAEIRFERFNQVSHPSLKSFRQCYVIREYKGDILFGMDNGLYVYNYASGNFAVYTRANGLPDDNIRSICTDNGGTIWLGTLHGGLVRFDPSSGKFTAFTDKNGLPDNTVYSIVEDNKGFLWIGTNKGLCRFDLRHFTSRNFTMKDGIQNYEYNTNSVCKTSSGELAFGGRTGFNLFNPDSIDQASEPPPVVITQVHVLNQERPVTDKMQLAYQENSISFQFAALGFFRNKENQYAYMLEGVDKEWVYCGDRRFTNYANLAPGQYTFRVKASNSYGLWNENGPSISLLVATPWWSSWYFRIAVIVTIIILVYLLFLYRLRQRFHLIDVRNKIARDLHDEIGSNLSSISLFSEVAKEKARTHSQGVSPLLKKISEYTQVSQEAMNDIVWMINARNDRFENIIVHMRTLAGELLEAKNIVLHLDLDERLNSMKMEMSRRKNFYLIYKEAVNNIVKYAECQNVWIGLKLRHSDVHLSIRDDGKGFDQDTAKRGNGLINMKRRAEALGGKLEILSVPGQGTTIELILKV